MGAMHIIVHNILDPVFDNSSVRVELNLRILRRRDLFFISTGLQPLDDGTVQVFSDGPGSEACRGRSVKKMSGGHF